MSELIDGLPPGDSDPDGDWGGFEDEDLLDATLQAEAAGLREDDDQEAAAWLAGLPDDVRQAWLARLRSAGK